jgi:hypothetical protein
MHVRLQCKLAAVTKNNVLLGRASALAKSAGMPVSAYLMQHPVYLPSRTKCVALNSGVVELTPLTQMGKRECDIVGTLYKDLKLLTENDGEGNYQGEVRSLEAAGERVTPTPTPTPTNDVTPTQPLTIAPKDIPAKAIPDFKSTARERAAMLMRNIEKKAAEESKRVAARRAATKGGSLLSKLPRGEVKGNSEAKGGATAQVDQTGLSAAAAAAKGNANLIVETPAKMPVSTIE